MTILQIVPSILRTGPVNVALDLIKTFTMHGHKCLLLYFDENGLHDGIECDLYNIKDINSIPWNIIDIAHAHGYRPIKLLSEIRYKYPAIKRVCTLHNYLFDDFKYEYGVIKGFIGAKLFLRSLSKANALMVALSRHAARYYCRLLKTNSVTYAYNCRAIDKYPLDTEDINTLSHFRQNCCLLGTISVLNKRKNIDAAIKALKLLPDNYKLCIVGDGPDAKRLASLSKSLGLENRVLFTGKKKDAYRYLEYFDIYLLPSKSEGFPLSIIEACAYNSTIVASKLPMLYEIFNDGQNIVFADVNNTEDFKDKILQAKRMSNHQSLELYTQFFTSDCLYKQYSSIYTKVLEES